MQLRMSPGGSMLSSLRRRPLDPPSSLTVTTAQSSLITGSSVFEGERSTGRETKCLRPFSRVERPVPPPIAMTRSPRPDVFSRPTGHETAGDPPLWLRGGHPRNLLRSALIQLKGRGIEVLCSVDTRHV